MANAPGQQFADWTTVPSITETLRKKGGSVLLNTLGIGLSGFLGQGDTADYADDTDAMGGQNIGIQNSGQGMQIPLNSIAPNLGQFGAVPPSFQSLAMQPLPTTGTDLDGDGQIDDFWGIKK